MMSTTEGCLYKTCLRNHSGNFPGDSQRLAPSAIMWIIPWEVPWGKIIPRNLHTSTHDFQGSLGSNNNGQVLVFFQLSDLPLCSVTGHLFEFWY